MSRDGRFLTVSNCKFLLIEVWVIKILPPSPDGSTCFGEHICLFFQFVFAVKNKKASGSSRPKSSTDRTYFQRRNSWNTTSHFCNSKLVSRDCLPLVWCLICLLTSIANPSLSLVSLLFWYSTCRDFNKVRLQV